MDDVMENTNNLESLRLEFLSKVKETLENTPIARVCGAFCGLNQNVTSLKMRDLFVTVSDETGNIVSAYDNNDIDIYPYVKNIDCFSKETVLHQVEFHFMLNDPLKIGFDGKELIEHYCLELMFRLFDDKYVGLGHLLQGDFPYIVKFFISVEMIEDLKAKVVLYAQPYHHKYNNFLRIRNEQK